MTRTKGPPPPPPASSQVHLLASQDEHFYNLLFRNEKNNPVNIFTEIESSFNWIYRVAASRSPPCPSIWTSYFS